MKIPIHLGVLAAALTLGQASIADDTNSSGHPGKRPNIIVILADDYGKDAASLYYPATEAAEFPETAPTLALAKLAEQGILFTNAWAQPACTATRGTRSLGTYPSTNGVGTALGFRTPRFGAPGSLFDGVEFPPTMVNPHEWHSISQHLTSLTR